MLNKQARMQLALDKLDRLIHSIESLDKNLEDVEKDEFLKGLITCQNDLMKDLVPFLDQLFDLTIKFNEEITREEESAFESIEYEE